MKKKFYITTAIPYVNASPHIGFALELVQADAVARYRRGVGDTVYFLTGADENSLKNVQAAEKTGLPTSKFVDQNTKRFVELSEILNISNDAFIRTTEPRHHRGAQKLWSGCKPTDIYKKKYQGLYCVGCEQFYTEKELKDGKCPEHLTAPEVVEEENYFFKLSNYQKKLEQLIATDKYKIVPETRKNEVLSFIRMGLEDFSISRSRQRAKNWGVSVPHDKDQVMYVWFDALSNYITALDYATAGKKFKQFWPCDVHAIGKGIIRFHAVYWPAMLLSAGIPLPKTLFVHDYINSAGTKMSKSLGNVVDPFEVAKKYGTEATRYYLLRYIHPFKDSDFSFKHFEEVFTADLSNGVGNLVSRVSGLIEQNKVKIKLVKITTHHDFKAMQTKLGSLMEQFDFNGALKFIWDIFGAIDGDISKREPWVLAKQGKIKELQAILNTAANQTVAAAYLLQPFLPATAQTIIKTFSAKKITKGSPLFPRLN
ncbi:MAG: methionine--tRNA ligase [Candidatus Buchananbacteria bacterium RIFCSPHIGHO2_01_FULL_47_11b]|uniref:Methionine--tRNA ligase n=1 Tax=Candidatus Buchananbacteria bacterium RIFCSPHIGHO2_01_FULL_47_11b TaxID=1797537 RepID=A0A1G1Y3J7_9BACT|nr:MAG: methionine--tRNA ligase [Candidatus Buchananbacteria bacterium RIFCSPHIGHO2_01_FULL_47_11b]